MQTLEKTQHPLIEKLQRISHLKESRLVLSIDLKSGEKLLQLAEACASSICVLKTHIDVLDDFDPYIAQELRHLADTENFILFEDRKFADIGNIVEMQYAGGIYQIADWAHLTNAHILPGPEIIEALKKVGASRGNGLLLIAQSSSQDNLLDKGYAQRAVAMAMEHRDFVVGFICEEKLCDGFIHMIPTGEKGITPECALQERKCDYIIVGKEIVQSADPRAAAEEYRQRSWCSVTR